MPEFVLPAENGHVLHVVATDRSHGDLHVDSSDVQKRRRAIVDVPWTWLRQVHGNDVVAVDVPGAHAGAEADASFTAAPKAALAVNVADCAPVALLSTQGLIGVAHAGWRGVSGGVLENTVEAMRNAGAQDLVGVLGPCIRPSAYEFGEPELSEVQASLGPDAIGATAWGTPALNMPAAVSIALDRCGVALVATLGGCTAAEADRRWSHRARADRERQALVAWID